MQGLQNNLDINADWAGAISTSDIALYSVQFTRLGLWQTDNGFARQALSTLDLLRNHHVPIGTSFSALIMATQIAMVTSTDCVPGTGEMGSRRRVFTYLIRV